MIKVAILELKTFTYGVREFRSWLDVHNNLHLIPETDCIITVLYNQVVFSSASKEWLQIQSENYLKAFN